MEEEFLAHEFRSYEEEFEEMRCIGRGQFGAAFLVRVRDSPEDEPIYYIAKKIILAQLTEKEQEGAYLEVRTFLILTFSPLFRLNFSKNWTTPTLWLTNTPSKKAVFSSL